MPVIPCAKTLRHLSLGEVEAEHGRARHQEHHDGSLQHPVDQRVVELGEVEFAVDEEADDERGEHGEPRALGRGDDAAEDARRG